MTLVIGVHCCWRSLQQRDEEEQQEACCGRAEFHPLSLHLVRLLTEPRSSKWMLLVCPLGSI
jgi:hypothetical protein